MKYMMSSKELARLSVIKGALDRGYTAKQARLLARLQAARKLGISVRWAKRLNKAVREQGDGILPTPPAKGAGTGLSP
jgi:hypothetical protein